MKLFIIIAQIVFVPAFSPLCIGIIRKIKSRLQNRQGADILQPYRDLVKLFHKDEVISNDASWIFRIAPFFIFTLTLLLSIGVPMLGGFSGAESLSDFLVVVYILIFIAFTISLAGIDVGGPFGGFGASREMTLSSLAEGAIIISLLVPTLMAGTTKFTGMMAHFEKFSYEEFLPLTVAFIAFFIAFLSKAARYPFDNPATHLELTMVHEAMILEYSGKRLALIEWSSANMLLGLLILGVNIFFPWGMPHEMIAWSLAFGFLLVVLKIFFALTLVAIIESTIPKLRYFRLPDLLLTSLVISLIALTFVII